MPRTTQSNCESQYSESLTTLDHLIAGDHSRFRRPYSFVRPTLVSVNSCLRYKEETHMTAQEARTHIRYSGWASRKVLEAALALPPEDLAKPMSVSHESIAKTLTHIYFADAIWYSRIADSSYPVPSHDALPSLEFVIQEWPRLQVKWEAWSDTASDEDVARQVAFKSRFVGNAGLPAWQIVMHVVNHATLHRGQIVAMLRQLGMTPPATDIVFYYFEQVAAAAS
jgi:uncharacterized damage-inducible protein DinB